VKTRYPELRVGLVLPRYQPKDFVLTSLDKSLLVKWAGQIGADFLLVHWSLFKPELLTIAKENHKSVFVWTVNDPEMMRRVLRDDLIDGMITDEPDTAILLQTELLKERN
jgi:glycerophosphoryl diester phosphodiesterase